MLIKAQLLEQLTKLLDIAETLRELEHENLRGEIQDCVAEILNLISKAK